MIVDDQLVAAAQSLLDRRFGDRAGAASAIYTLEGNMFTSVSVDCVNAGSSVEPETGALCEAFKVGERVSAVVTVIRRVDGGPVLFSTPAGPTIDRLCLVGAREAELAVHNLAVEDAFHIRPLKSLGATHISEIWLDGVYDDGMAPIVRELRDLARIQGLPSARDQWIPCLLSAFEHGLTRRYALSQGKTRHPFDFPHPNEAASYGLRLAWNAFENASHAFFRAMFDLHEEALRGLSMNDSDMLHLRQGSEALRFVFANLIVWVDRHKPVQSELPFAPYHSSRLENGRPMHEVFPAADEFDDPVDELINLLTRRDVHSMGAYLRQRGLFTHPVFENGTRRCPFDSVALEIYRLTGEGIQQAQTMGLLDPQYVSRHDAVA